MTHRSRRTFALCVLIGLGLPACTPTDLSSQEAPEDYWFHEEAASQGLSFKHNSGYRDIPYLPEINGSGVALVDVNGDGFLDVYLIQSGSLYTDEAQKWTNALFLNQGDGSFVAVQAGAAADTGYGMGVAAGDYDNDGDVDLFVTNVGANVLLRNDGNGSFTNVNEDAGIEGDAFSTSAAFADLDADGDLDLYVANYVNWSANSEVECYAGGIRAYCPPQKYNAPAVDQLYRNDGDGSFSDVTAEAGVAGIAGHGFGVVTADYDGDGMLDIFVATDMSPNHLWINQGDLTFRNEANVRGVAVDGMGRLKAGMGVSTADPDHDGDHDLLVVNMFNQTDSYFSNEGSYFRDVTHSLNINGTVRRFTRWGVALADFDNDGFLDLFEANGRVHPGDVRVGDIYAEPNVLFKGHSAMSFERVDPFVRSDVPLVHTSRGAAVGDLDNDGDLDVVVVNRDAEPYLLVNDIGSQNNWLTLSVLDPHGRDANGAVVSATIGERTHTVAVQVDGSFMSANDPRVHFGAGSVERILDVRVRWPEGGAESFGNFDANHFAVLRQGEGEPLQ